LQEDGMEHGTIEREIFVDAAPEIVYEVVSSPDHLRHWWPDEARFTPAAGSAGEIVFGDPAAGGKTVPLTVIDTSPPKSFSFRWDYPAGAAPTINNSLLVTFDLTPSGPGTLLKMTETGFREQGWEAAVLEERYQDHVTGWAHFLPRLLPYVATLRAHHDPEN
jgi:uncharacterized protein YndB with AHSA1/START domain